MSGDWREREFAHESEAYFRSLDQVSGSPAEPCMGYHVENGQSVCDWFTFTHKGVKIKIVFHRPEKVDYTVISIEGLPGIEIHKIALPHQEAEILAARHLAIKMFDAESGDFAQES